MIDDPIIPVNQLPELVFIDSLVNLEKHALAPIGCRRRLILRHNPCPGWRLVIDPAEDGHVQSGDEAAVKLVPGGLFGMEPPRPSGGLADCKIKFILYKPQQGQNGCSYGQHLPKKQDAFFKGVYLGGVVYSRF